MFSSSPAHELRPLALATSDDVAALLRINDYPAVTLVTSGEGSVDELRARLRALSRVAHRRLVAEFGAGHASIVDLDRRLTELIASVKSTSSEPTVAVFVSPTSSRLLAIGQPALERVVIDDTFATRDLLDAELRNLRTWVLHLAPTARLFDGSGERFTELHTRDFPLDTDDPVDAGAPDRNRRGHGEPSAERDRRIARQIQRLQTPLRDVLRADPRPLILVGSPRRAAMLGRAGNHGHLVAAHLPWSGRSITADEVQKAVRETINGLLEKRSEQAMAAIDAAIKAGRLSSGIENCWIVAVHGLASHVVVERSCSASGRVDRDSGAVTLTADLEAPDVVDDVVDDLLEHVLAHRGVVTVVPDGALGDLGSVVVCERAPLWRG